MSAAPVVVCAAAGDARGCEPAAAAVGVALAAAHGAAALAVVEGERRGPTVLAAEAARELEAGLAESGLDASARGRLCWVAAGTDDEWRDPAASVVAVARSRGVPALLVLPAGRWHEALADDTLFASAVLLRADLPADRSLCALAVGEAREAGLPVKVLGRAPGRVAARRALAGIDPGGQTGRRAATIAGRLAAIARSGLPGQSGQASPLVLGAVLLLCFGALLLAAIGGAVTGQSRAQRVADLSALSAARSMRDDFSRLFVAARLESGAPNPVHLSRSAYLERARSSALEAARRNGADPGRLALDFPDGGSFAPLRVRVEVRAEIEGPGGAGLAAPRAWALAEAIPEADASGDGAGASMASGGGYAGPLEYRQGRPMRPDVARAFDRMAVAARADGVALGINSGFRSDAEQAALWAENPDPRWVAPPGTSLHRCATELDLGPPPAYAWLAANAGRFGFLRRYSWEPWHYGFADGPPPCSEAGDRVAAGGGGEPAPVSLPAFVPARFREPILAAASRWNVSAGLLAAQLLAESNFNPFAVSPAGAAGIAQFMPDTATAYGLGDAFDARAAIDAQAHLMSDLLAQFGGRTDLALAAYNAGPAPVEACDCIPPYTETQAYVARITALMDGAGEVVAPALEVRLVR